MFIVRKPGAKGRGQPAPHPEVLEWSTGGEGREKEGKGEQESLFFNCTRNHTLLSEG